MAKDEQYAYGWKRFENGSYLFSRYKLTPSGRRSSKDAKEVLVPAAVMSEYDAENALQAIIAEGGFDY